MNFVPIDLYEEDFEFVHVNPNIIVYAGIRNTEGAEAFIKEFPSTVVTYLINHEEINYYFKTKEEAKVFIKKVGGLI